VAGQGREALTLEDQKVVLVALEEAEQFDDTRMIDTAHDLDLFENVRTLNVVSPDLE
jgi:hypothetical protein